MHFRAEQGRWRWWGREVCSLTAGLRRESPRRLKEEVARNAMVGEIRASGGFSRGVSQGDGAGDRVFGAIERGQIEPVECAGRREGGESVVDAGAHAGDQFLSGFQRAPREPNDVCRFAGLRLREDFKVDIGGVAKVHRAISGDARDLGALRLPGGCECARAAERRATVRVAATCWSRFPGGGDEGGSAERERARTQPGGARKRA